MRICVVGTGYVGLVGAAVFAEKGHSVIGVDKDASKINKILKGIMPIYEPGLEELVVKNIKEGRLEFTTNISYGIQKSDIIFICVGTPQGNTGAADLTAVMEVATQVGKNLNGYKIVVTKSTVPVGTNEKVEKTIRENAPKNARFDVVSNPEFLREGSAVEDMFNTNRTVIGAKSQKALKIMKELYKDFNAPIVECDLRSAEMIKYAANAFLATKISFINEIGQLCERAGANVEVVAEGIGLDKRIGRGFLNVSGVGYGGSCFPKDVAALYKTSTDQAYDFKLLRAVMEVNELQKENFMKKITRSMGENLSPYVFCILGLAFKGNTDDVRESGAIKVVRMIRGAGAKIQAFDPAAMENAKKILGTNNIVYANSEYEAAKNADAICILTEWEQFKNMDLKKIKKAMKGNLIFDARNILNQQAVESAGFIYFATGKRSNGYTEEGNVISTALLKNGK